MSNLDKAVKLLGDANLPGRTLHPRQVKAIAVTLEAAGLLAPDGESWEYQVQARSMKSPAWEPSINGILQKWYGAEDIEEAKGKARAYTPYFHGREKVEIRVLRRRVSPPEVINE